MTPHAWNRVIDDVARDMTSGAPTPDFRARVMERVSATRPAGRLTRLAWNWRGASVAAALVVVAVAVSVLQPFRTGEPSRAVARVATPAAPIVASNDPVAIAEASQVPRGARRPAVPPTPAALAEWRARNIPALDGLPAIELGHIQPMGLSISQLSVRPLDDIAPIVVPSIPQSEGGR